MAERRMFSKSIVLSDAFLDMPMGSRCLYMTLGMLADDDGFVSSPKSIMRQCGASVDDMKILLAKKFLIEFDSGIIVIKHWRINNYLRSDRYTETNYTDEKKSLEIEANGAYHLKSNDGIPSGIPNGYQVDTQDSIGKDSIGKYIDNIGTDKPSTKSNRFVKPTVDEIHKYIAEKGYAINAEKFFNYYESNGWMVGRNRMKDWQAAIRTWATHQDKNPVGYQKFANAQKPSNSSFDVDDFFNSAIKGS